MRPYRAFRGYGIVLSKMIATPDLDTLNERQLRALARTLLATVSEKEALLSHKDHDIRFKEATIAKQSYGFIRSDGQTKSKLLQFISTNPCLPSLAIHVVQQA